MRLPEYVTERQPALGVLEEDWAPVSPPVLAAWVVFYVIVLVGALSGGGLARWIDLVFVPIHEGGHLLFGWSGSHWLTVAGGTLLQLFVPFALALYFVLQRQIAGTAFCAFFFFEQFLPVGTYMADARSQSLTYVTVGDPDKAEHDWYYLFSHAGVLDADTTIGGLVRAIGWIGMIAVVGWLIWRAWPKEADRKKTGPQSYSGKGASRVEFGDLGSNVESAGKSEFWRWFQLEQTGEQKGVRRFQPNGPKFRALCYVDVTTASNGAIQRLTLGLQRKFIEGENEPFARDLVKSFLSAVFPQQRSEELKRFVEEVGSEFGGTNPAVVAGGAPNPPRSTQAAGPSPAYLVFTGQGKRCRLKSGALDVEEANVSESQTDWLCLQVQPSVW